MCMKVVVYNITNNSLECLNYQYIIISVGVVTFKKSLLRTSKGNALQLHITVVTSNIMISAAHKKYYLHHSMNSH